MSTYLTDEEIDDVCQGLKQNAAKVRYLQMLGLHVQQKPNGKPLVLRRQLEQLARPVQNSFQPNWGAN